MSDLEVRLNARHASEPWPIGEAEEPREASLRWVMGMDVRSRRLALSPGPEPGWRWWFVLGGGACFILLRWLGAARS